MTRKDERQPTLTHTHRQRLDRAIALYLYECYRKRTAARVSEFAAFLGRNADYMTRRAAAILGGSLREYLRAKQIEEAERLLTTTPLPMWQVALHAGFGTVSTLYRCFRKVHHTSPGAFRSVRK
jgi:AraC-like DNA-binding protein